MKLNLGCGSQKVSGYVNVDKFGDPDVKADLEEFPWPWPDNGAEEVILNHVLEHLGRTTDIYFGIIQELYRVCRPGAKVRIAVPHPRHNDFISDPTHVRAITTEGLALFSKAKNREIRERGCADSPLAEYLNVDFNLLNHEFIIDEFWMEKFKGLRVSEQELEEQFFHAIRSYNNVVKEIRIVLEAVK
ncbi:MAG: hypothetical protein O2960_06095 [Verrucomicrobia bacterium]|nr:hypothetical protein [Verrucomicrobiota bacterium]